MKRTAPEAAQAAGVPLRTWYAFEQGRSLNIEQLPRIAKALGCKVRLLLPDE
jgi:predicted transcriptional regulator